jgi:hypothetical protein
MPWMWASPPPPNLSGVVQGHTHSRRDGSICRVFELRLNLHVIHPLINFGRITGPLPFPAGESVPALRVRPAGFCIEAMRSDPANFCDMQ